MLLEDDAITEGHIILVVCLQWLLFNPLFYIQYYYHNISYSFSRVEVLWLLTVIVLKAGDGRTNLLDEQTNSAGA